MLFSGWHEPLPSFRTYSAEETIELAARIGTHLCAGDVLLLTGDLGAGKTQFSRGVGKALGVTESIISPTFNILLVHDGAELTLHHWDLYRLDDPDDLVDIDYFANVESDAVSLVEWGDKFEDTLLDADVEVQFSRVSEHERLIEMAPLSARGEELVRDATVPVALDDCSVRDAELLIHRLTKQSSKTIDSESIQLADYSSNDQEPDTKSTVFDE
jgi:tRNA threonylcarbamoyladenosine biosynthesis protein TsaE